MHTQCCCIFQELINTRRHAYMVLWVKYAFGKSSCVSKVPAFLLKSHLCSKKLDKNRSRIRIHFATNRFTFEKFQPPPPLLHPNIYTYLAWRGLQHGHTHKHTETHAYVYICIHIYIHVCIYIFSTWCGLCYEHTPAHTNTQLYININTYIHTYMYRHGYIQRHVPNMTWPLLWAWVEAGAASINESCAASMWTSGATCIFVCNKFMSVHSML